MAQNIFNVFAFYGEKYEQQKLWAAAMCHEHGAMCATDKDGKPQAFFRPPVKIKRSVLGVQRIGRLRLEHRPTLMIELKAK